MATAAEAASSQAKGGADQDVEDEEPSKPASFMKDLDDDGLATLKELAEFVEKCHAEEKVDDEDHGRTLIEYCLFAHHKATGLPMVAHMAYRNSSYVEYFLKLASLPHWRLSTTLLLLEIIGTYSDQNPRIVPAMAYFFAMRYDLVSSMKFHDTIFERSFKLFGKSMACAGTLDQLGETQLTALVRFPRFSSGVLREFMDHVPGAADAVNVQHSSDGSTPAHLCVKYNMADHLEVLINCGADLTLKDHGGRTVVDLALIGGNPAIMQLLECIDAHQQQPSGSKLLSDPELGSFPKVYLPSAPDLKPSQTNDVILEYLRRELPQLLAMDTALVVVPPVVDCCPYPAETPLEKGWMAEMKVLKAVVTALEGLREENPSFHLACFHDLRYGCRLSQMGNWESDFDIAVFCFEEETGLQAFMIFEIKSITRAKDVVRNAKQDGTETKTIGTHALDQLCSHINALEEHTGISAGPGWVIPCLALPNFPTAVNRPGRPSEEDGNLKKNWKAFLERAVDSADPKVAAYSKIMPRLLTRIQLENVEEFKNWFQEILFSIKESSKDLDIDEAEKRRDAYSTLLAWCVAHCMGIAVQKVSSRIDEQSEKVTELALLTIEQKKVLQRVPCPNSHPLFIVGAAGTGKTLLGIQKLVRCEQDGFLDADKRGLFLTRKENVGLICLVEKHLKINSCKFVEVQPIDATNLLTDLRTIQKERRFFFLVLDQLEDMLTYRSDFMEVLRAVEQVTCFDIFWVTVNPSDMSQIHHEKLEAFLSIPENAGHSVHLARRIRNTADIGGLVDRWDMGAWSLPHRCAAEPAGTITSAQGISIFAEFYDDENGASVLAEVLRHLLLDTAVRDKDIVIIETADSKKPNLTFEVDPSLADEFCEPKNRRVPSLAPLLVQAAWVGDIKECLSLTELHEVRKLFLSSLSQEGSPAPAGSALLQVFKQCLENYANQKEEWAGISGDLLRSVALQATLSLVSRFVTWAEKKVDHEFLLEFAGALKASSAQNLQDLILRHRCISVLNKNEIGGYEADVVVIWDLKGELLIHDPTSSFRKSSLYASFSRLLARAKVMAVLLVPSIHKEKLEQLLRPLKKLITER